MTSVARPSPRNPRIPLKYWLLAGLVGWAGLGLLIEVNRILTAYDQRGARRDIPGLWRPGTRAPARLAACLEAVDRRIPPGASVSILSRPGLGEAEFFTWRWAAYLLPLRDVLPETAARGGTPRDFVVAFQRPVDEAGARPVQLLTGCQLYRPVSP